MGLTRMIIRWRLAAFAERYGYDTSYLDDLADADVRAFLTFARVTSLSRYRKGVPLSPWYAVKVIGAMHEDCGPCTQLVVRMAEEAGVDAPTLRAVIAGDDAALDADVRLAARFARASLAHDLAADPLRDEIVARWGRRGLVSLGFALVSARLFPTLKYALGHGRTCSRIVVGDTPVMPAAPNLTAEAS